MFADLRRARAYCLRVVSTRQACQSAIFVACDQLKKPLVGHNLSVTLYHRYFDNVHLFNVEAKVGNFAGMCVYAQACLQSANMPPRPPRIEDIVLKSNFLHLRYIRFKV